MSGALAAVTSYYAEDQPRALLEDFQRLTPAQQTESSAPVLFALGAASTSVPPEVLTSLVSPQARQEAMNAHLQGLTLRDATLAETWARTLPEGSLRESAFRGLEHTQRTRGSAAGLDVLPQAE